MSKTTDIIWNTLLNNVIYTYEEKEGKLQEVFKLKVRPSQLVMDLAAALEKGEQPVELIRPTIINHLISDNLPAGPNDINLDSKPGIKQRTPSSRTGKKFKNSNSRKPSTGKSNRRSKLAKSN